MTQEIDGRLADTTNLTYDMRWPNSGPRTTGKAISLMMYGKDPVALNQAVDATMARISAPEVGAINVSTERRVPGKEMSFIPNRHLIALSDTSLTEIGAAINIASGGYKLGDVSLPGYDEELEVIAREPEEDRSKTFLNSLRVATGSGPLRLDSVGYWRTQDGVAVIYRENGRRALEIEADIGPKKQLSGVSAAIEAVMVDIVKEYPSVTYRLGGEAEDNAETQAFMVKALAMAVALMMAVLLYQLNSFKQTFIVMLAVVFSVLGVLLTLLILRAPFGSVFSGLAILSLAGISINQNIVLIDDFNERLSHGGSRRIAAIEASISRFKPIMLTSITTIMGLLPMVFMVSGDVEKMAITIGDPAMLMWSNLSSNIVGGLLFSVVMSLFVTPTLLGMKRKGIQRK